MIERIQFDDDFNGKWEEIRLKYFLVPSTLMINNFIKLSNQEFLIIGKVDSHDHSLRRPILTFNVETKTVSPYSCDPPSFRSPSCMPEGFGYREALKLSYFYKGKYYLFTDIRSLCIYDFKKFIIISKFVKWR